MRSAAVACATLAGYLVFLAAVALGGPCPEPCADDAPEGACPPLCMACPCSPRSAPPAAPPVAAQPLARGELVPAPATVAPFEPEPGDIFHVPRRLLA
jgi:hypothetical protein